MSVATVSKRLQEMQRKRSILIKSRIMQANRLQAVVAGTLGYSSGMKEADRLKKMSEAAKLIVAVGKGEADSPLKSIINVTLIGIGAFEAEESVLDKAMVKAAKELPVASWVEEPDQCGFGLPSLGTVVGETGDLFLYANPAKVWRRLGCAPFTFKDQTLMGSTWRFGKEGKLPAEAWTEYGYSPRRRSIAYVIGENLLRLNHGPYRIRYEQAKERAAEMHPEWTVCRECSGKRKVAGKNCDNCKGTGKAKMRIHRHGMLLATKLLLKNLWIRWHGGDAGIVTGIGHAVCAAK